MPSQAGAFMGSAGVQQMQGSVPGGMPQGMPGAAGQAPSFFAHGQQPQASQPFLGGAAGLGFGQPNNAFQGQGQMPGLFGQPGQQPAYQQANQQVRYQAANQQGVAGFQPFGQQPAYQAANQLGMYQQAGQQGGFPQYQSGMPQGQTPGMGFGVGQAIPGAGVMNGMQTPQAANGGLQPQMAAVSSQPGGIMSATSLSTPAQEGQGGDGGLFRNLVEDVRGSLPKTQNTSSTMGGLGGLGSLGGLGGFGGMPQAGYQSDPASLQQGYGNPKPGLSPSPLMGQPPLMSQSSLMGTTPQNTFSTSGNPFA
ncbi:unnamed protein product [Ostreobium quekettii]|uniref:Uncharacterized protein n=1 Tax=Ostreobium quekettii TaxID=121088 RepID=A0A8S1J2L5_9CHLO|nr:unnamed protein product [Ostreobium quekettii]|eukprot:evm.model.scf_1683EXC.11 EVM.evm.TU.scf_1683EXC.11   scf_1683EXC:34158-35081(-)